MECKQKYLRKEIGITLVIYVSFYWFIFRGRGGGGEAVFFLILFSSVVLTEKNIQTKAKDMFLDKIEEINSEAIRKI